MGSEEGSSQAVWHLALPPDHLSESDREARGPCDTHTVLLSGEEARRLFVWCRRHAIPATRVVQRLAEYLAKRWSRNTCPEPGVTAREIAGDSTRDVMTRACGTVLDSPGSLSMALDDVPETATRGTVALTVSWDESTLDQRTMAAFLDSLRTLVTGWLADPATDLADLPLLSHAAVDRLLSLGDGGTASEVRYRTALEAILGWAERHPLAPAIRFASRTVTYRDLVLQQYFVA